MFCMSMIVHGLSDFYGNNANDVSAYHIRMQTEAMSGIILVEVMELDIKTVNTDFLIQAGPYSHIVIAGEFIFLSGIDPIDIQKSLIITDDIEKATEIVMENMKKSLESVGSSLDKVVKVTIFMRDMADFNKLNDVYARYFTKACPARTCVAVKEVPGNFPLKVEAIAVK